MCKLKTLYMAVIIPLLTNQNILLLGNVWISLFKFKVKFYVSVLILAKSVHTLENYSSKEIESVLTGIYS